MNPGTLNWPCESICLHPPSWDAQSIAADVYDRTCRTDFAAPGFCSVNAGESLDSVAFRRGMVALKRAMGAIHEARSTKKLVYVSAARFDQQESTKPHLDGGPEECFLMLGYEPSEVDAELEIADYAKCAFDLGLSPQEFMARHNPMFQSGYELLRPYSTRVPCFSRSNYQILCVNNSSARFSLDQPAWQGVLHTATILTPDESKRRIINSTMIATAATDVEEGVSETQQQEFMHTSAVRRRGYDKSHLVDDH